MREPRILVLNPNSSESVTEGLRRALAPLCLEGGPRIECATLEGAPPAIESDADVAAVEGRVRDWCKAREGRAGAFVIACFSDPGIALARNAVRGPVFGMAESGYLSAMARGERFGVISILSGSVPRHLRYVERLGIASRLAADLPLELGVLELDDGARTLPRMTEVGRQLRDEHGAASVIMGCAGMARYRGPLETALGIPVIEPVQAAVAMAMGAVLL